MRTRPAQYYPAGYWASLLQVPAADEFPGTGPQGNGIAPEMKTQAHWLAWMKNGSCLTCHQLGNKATREIPPELGVFASSREAWMRRIQSGQAGGDMVREIALFGPQRAVGMFADWTDRIAAGELPPSPPRPQGVERNAVISQWHWADARTYLHDQVSTDRRAPHGERVRIDLRRSRAQHGVAAGPRSGPSHDEPRGGRAARCAHAAGRGRIVSAVDPLGR
jgi:hypothetical protein